VNRTLVLGVLPAALLAGIAAPLIIFWGDLPEPMAIHWGLDGRPDGSLARIGLLLLLGGVYLAMWVAVWRMAVRVPFDLASFAAGLAGVGALLAAVSWISVVANRDTADWTAAGDFTGIHIVVVFVAAVVVGFAGWRLAGGRSGYDRPAGEIPTIDLSADETVVWSGVGRGSVLIAIGLVTLVIAVAMWSPTSLALIAIAALVLSFSEVRATVSERGVAVSLGWLGIPSWLVPMGAIERAEVEEVRPMAYGGWGYRLRPGVRALVVRGGPSLRLVRTAMPDLVLTVADAETGAGVVNALNDRSA
jgi:hypothetical protein